MKKTSEGDKLIRKAARRGYAPAIDGEGIGVKRNSRLVVKLYHAAVQVGVYSRYLL